ncbi:DUF3618 domain-containing protein [Limnoglobus roseus]|uniref:DUF3618 domain-containing protein n=1 Tax=Limnoglobus roseus TaxID=2598579 RepID=A0A5C1A3G9_9BACT|nr:DUF3618 domain-containing protein [Limnoglobus roseus]QEL13631.1 hypothetical protein PX52LOC_00489 [Limnoglobus roseus]
MEQKIDPLTPPERTPEEIEREMAQTREAISEKVAALETQVMSTVQTAADTISGTVEAVKEMVTTGPGAISDTVKESLTSVGDAVKEQLDFSKKIRDNPWESVLAATAAGVIAGLFAFGRRPPSATAEMTPAAQRFADPVPSSPPPPREPGLLDGVWNHIRQELTQLAEEAWKTASESLRENIHTEVPNLIKTTVESGTTGVVNRLKNHV